MSHPYWPRRRVANRWGRWLPHPCQRSLRWSRWGARRCAAARGWTPPQALPACASRASAKKARLPAWTLSLRKELSPAAAVCRRLLLQLPLLLFLFLQPLLLKFWPWPQPPPQLSGLRPPLLQLLPSRQPRLPPSRRLEAGGSGTAGGSGAVTSLEDAWLGSSPAPRCSFLLSACFLRLSVLSFCLLSFFFLLLLFLLGFLVLAVARHAGTCRGCALRSWDLGL